MKTARRTGTIAVATVVEDVRGDLGGFGDFGAFARALGVAAFLRGAALVARFTVFARGLVGIVRLMAGIATSVEREHATRESFDDRCARVRERVDADREASRDDCVTSVHDHDERLLASVARAARPARVRVPTRSHRRTLPARVALASDVTTGCLQRCAAGADVSHQM
jgi:hypothetical protein